METEIKPKERNRKIFDQLFRRISSSFFFSVLADLIRKRKEILMLPLSCKARIHCFKMELTSEFH